jgi:hypothetical protein
MTFILNQSVALKRAKYTAVRSFTHEKARKAGFFMRYKGDLFTVDFFVPLG